MKRKLREVYAAEDNAMEVGSGRSASNEDLSQQTPEVPAVESSCTHVVFAEFFAGSACLTDAVKAEGVQVREPDDLAYGGVDFSKAADVTALKGELREIAASCGKLVLHLAPPCSSFSRARDRRQNTRLRSFRAPEGLHASAEVIKANNVAKRAARLASWAHEELQAVVTLENPDTS